MTLNHTLFPPAFATTATFVSPSPPSFSSTDAYYVPMMMATNNSPPPQPLFQQYIQQPTLLQWIHRNTPTPTTIYVPNQERILLVRCNSILHLISYLVYWLS
jgi:hypothetical protein